MSIFSINNDLKIAKEEIIMLKAQVKSLVVIVEELSDEVRHLKLKCDNSLRP